MNYKIEFEEGKNLTYSHCDDWLIFANNKNGKEYFVVTELWPEWLDLPKNASQEPDAIEKYMLPIALKKWDRLIFKRYTDL